MTAETWLSALQGLLQPSVILYLFAGIAIGTFIGALPGLSATMGIAIMTPITFWLDKTDGFAMLMGPVERRHLCRRYHCHPDQHPRTPASLTQAWDGYPLYKQGKGGLALGINVIFSFLGGVVSILMLILFAQPIADFTITFGAAEYFMVALFGISMMIGVAGGDVLKGLCMGAFGILLSCVGIDPILACKRFTFDITSLAAGIDFIPVMIGVFGLGEVFSQIYSRNREAEAAEVEMRRTNLALGRVLPTAKQMKAWTPPLPDRLPAATVVGAIPAAGGDISAIICWGNSKKFSKEGDKYGHGLRRGSGCFLHRQQRRDRAAP